jgi:spore coat protein U-like protein
MRFAPFAIALGFSISSLSSTSALAATSSASFGVSVTVQSTCQASTPAVAFGNRSTTGLSPVSVSCSQPTAYDVTLSADLSGSAAGKAVNPIKTMQVYKLLAGSAQPNTAGRIAGTKTMARGGNEPSSPGSYYSRGGRTQDVASGAFADAVTVTVTY